MSSSSSSSPPVCAPSRPRGPQPTVRRRGRRARLRVERPPRRPHHQSVRKPRPGPAAARTLRPDRHPADRGRRTRHRQRHRRRPGRLVRGRRRLQPLQTRRREGRRLPTRPGAPRWSGPGTRCSTRPASPPNSPTPYARTPSRPYAGCGRPRRPGGPCASSASRNGRRSGCRCAPGNWSTPWAPRPRWPRIHGLAKRSPRPVLRYWADFHPIRVRSASGSRSSRTNRTSPASRPSLRSLARVVLRNFGDPARSAFS